MSVNYKEMRVFQGNNLYLNEGMLHDAEATGHAPIAKLRYRDEDLKEGCPCYLVETDDNGMCIWTTEPRDSYWVKTLNTKAVEPLPKEFEVVLEKAKEPGKFCCFINSHPEINGQGSYRRKVFFPDHQWVGPLSEGPAIIHISHEKDRYGFVMGKMISFETPFDVDDFCRWCCEKGPEFIKNRSLMEMRSPARGHYWVMHEHFAYCSGRAYINSVVDNYFYIKEHKNRDGSVDYVLLYPSAVETDIEAGCCVNETPLNNLIAQTLYGCNSISELMDKFKTNWIFSCNRRLSEPWNRKQDLFMSLIQDRLDKEEFGGDIEDALNLLIYEGVFVPHTLLNRIPMLDIARYGEKAFSILSITPDEVDDLARFVNTLNDDSLEQIKELTKRGQLSISERTTF